jgi:uncharacterized membrane protein
MTTADLNEWLKLVARWVHVFAAILWVGQTYLFAFYERNLVRRARAQGEDDLREGHLWLVHGGGFYFVEKRRKPETGEETLHWFKWEAASTWISGVILLVLLYYMGGLLVEPQQSYGMALGVGLGSIVLGWLVYDGLVRSPLGRHPAAFAALGLVLIVALLVALRQVQSGRAAFLHVGAVLGTIMAANVWLRILPSQRRMLAEVAAGRLPPPDLASTGPLRSTHNTFLVVPLTAIMVSNHYPTITYGHRHAWAALAVILLVGWGGAKLIRSWR